MSARRVLLVDDSSAVRRAVALMLEGEEYQCLQASDGQDALSVLDEQHVDLVVADLHMPVMDGFALIREMRKRDRHRFTPVLVLTTECRDEVISTLKRAGVTGVLQKPIERATLREAVRRALA